MANNFRKTGTLYYSKAGHDSNDGLTKDSPKKSIIDPLAPDIVIIGAGIYTNSDFTGSFSSGSCVVKGDGYVILNNPTIQANNNGTDYSFFNLTLNGGYAKRGNSNRGLRFENCTLIDVEYFNQSGGNGLFNCILINNQSTDSCTVFDGCIVINSSNALNTQLIDSYIDINSTINFQSAYSNFQNNNVQGLIQLEGTFYAIQDQFVGTPQDNGYAVGVEWLNEANLTANGYTGTIVGWDAAVATCVNRAPLFNDASKLDFTLQANSPHIGRANDGVSNIGGTEYSQSFYAGVANPNILKLEGDADIDNTTNSNDWVLQPTSTQGSIRAIVKVSDSLEELGEINYIGNYSFDSDEIGGTSANFNVPDSKPVTNDYPDYLTTTSDAANDTSVVVAGHSYTAGQWLKVDGQYREIDSVDANTLYFLTPVRAIVLSGTGIQVGSFSSLASLNPNRLNMIMRSSLSTDVNSSNWDDNSTWDNNSLATAGAYLAQEWNNVPMIDNLNGVGFGDDNYDEAFGNPIQARYIDILIYLRDDYKS